MANRKWVAGGGLCFGAAVFVCVLFAEQRPATAQHETVYNLGGMFDNENDAGKLLEAEVNFWITKIENHLKSFSTKMTKYDIIQRNFQRNLNDNDFNTSTEDPHDIVRALARDISRMIGKKEAALKRLMDTMENKGKEETRMSKSPDVEGTTFYDARRLPRCGPSSNMPPPRPGRDRGGGGGGGGPGGELNCIELTSANPRFSVDINTSYSVVHVPKNVYNRDNEVLQTILASDQLDDTFKYNFKKDPYPSWQFFGSSSGALRYFPAAEWQTDPEFTQDDVFDARMRPWYIRAATSPKHMVILLDWSGSMTGLRREIAKHVVFTILDTLNDDDYFNIYKFAQDVEPVVPCLNDTLVQANTEYVDLFKATLNEGKTEYIANFSLALTRAFDVLSKYNDSNMGGDKCNQAIMLVTDGAPDTYHEIFKKYNWPHMYVRVFTYLIGKEVRDVSEVEWMACSNKGFFVHVTTLAEVKEQVLRYIPVMARPLVMYGKNPIVWSQVYADRVSTQLSDWLWEKKQRQKQRFRYRNFRDIKRAIDYNNRQWFEEHGADKARMKPGTVDEDYLRQSYYNFLASGSLSGWPSPQAKREALKTPHKTYKFVTTVSIPALDKREVVNVSERVLKHEAIWVEKIKEKRQANILGVAGIDVPIADFQMLAPHHKLGVNGYFFMVTNNGHIMFHRDFRPVFKDYMLKPNYNSVDLYEVELEDGVEGLFANDTRLLRMRKKIVLGQNGFEKKLRVKVPLDNLKRVAVYEQDYGFYPVQREDSPEARRSMPDAALYTPHFRTHPTPDAQVIFALGAAWPSSYGRIKYTGHVEVSRDYTRHQRDVSQILKTDKNWRLHPDWVYCSYHRKDIQRHRFETPEDELIHFLERMGRPPNFQWRPERVPLNDSDPENYFCDKDLVQYLLHDALATDVFNSSGNGAKYERPEDEPSVLRAFVATRSGLTRWRDYHKVPQQPIGAPITGDDYDDTEYYAEDIMWKENNAKAIDEPWYRRTVIFNEEESEENSFVYSVPYDASNYNDCVVTATKAIYLHKPSDWYKKTPIAVVGFQFKHSYFSQIFMNVTRKCSTDARGADSPFPRIDDCPLTCAKETLNCYLLDEHAWVVESEKPEDVGKFFGIIDARIMDSLVQDDIYPTSHIYDYQGVCLTEFKRSGPGNTLINPFTHIASLAVWFWTNLFWFIANLNFAAVVHSLGSLAQEHSFPMDYDSPSTRLGGPADPSYYDGGEDDQKTYDYVDPQAPHGGEGQPGAEGGSGAAGGDGADGGGGAEDNLDDNYGDYADSFLVPQFEDAYINKTKPSPCPLEVNLVYLNVSKIRNATIKGKLSDCGNRKGCSRHFTVRKIPSTNLVFLAVETPCNCRDSDSHGGNRRRGLTAVPMEIEELKNKTGETRCRWLNRRLFSRRPSDCPNYHPEEEKIKDCTLSGAFGRHELALTLLLTNIAVSFGGWRFGTSTTSLWPAS